jgi:hypothetical protein
VDPSRRASDTGQARIAERRPCAPSDRWYPFLLAFLEGLHRTVSIQRGPIDRAAAPAVTSPCSTCAAYVSRRSSIPAFCAW